MFLSLLKSQLKRKREEEEEEKEERNDNKKRKERNDNKNNDNEQREKKERLPTRRKVAILFAYYGEGYQGSKTNQYAKTHTIEDDLVEALRKAGCLRHVSSEGHFFSKRNKVNWTRAETTSKGVSAVGDVVSLKIITQPEDTLVERINSHLPSAIRILKVYDRVIGRFHAHNHIISCVYEYLIPTSALVPILENYSPSFTNERLEKVRSVLKLFEGTHNFWNYTGSKDFDPRQEVWIHSVACGDPFIVEETEFVKVTLDETGLTNNQIKTMMSMLILVIRHSASLNLIQNSFSKRKCPLPIAPGEFLLLKKIRYPGYKATYQKMNPKKEALYPDSPGMEEKREDFKMAYIYPNVVKMEKEQNIMRKFVQFGVDRFKPVVDGVKRDLYEWLKENRELYPDF